MRYADRVTEWPRLISRYSSTVAVLLFLLMPSAAATTTKEGVCANNLRMIHGAVEQWAMENKLARTDSYSLSDTNLLSYMKGGVIKSCPAGGVYSAGKSIADEPVCSIHGTESLLQRKLGQRRPDPVELLLGAMLLCAGVGGAFWILRSLSAQKNSSP